MRRALRGSWSINRRIVIPYLRSSAVPGLAALWVVLAGTIPASAQAFSYRFSSCSSGVSMQVDLPITSVQGPTSTGNGGRSTIYTSNTPLSP